VARRDGLSLAHKFTDGVEQIRRICHHYRPLSSRMSSVHPLEIDARPATCIHWRVHSLESAPSTKPPTPCRRKRGIYLLLRAGCSNPKKAQAVALGSSAVRSVPEAAHFRESVQSYGTAGQGPGRSRGGLTRRGARLLRKEELAAGRRRKERAISSHRKVI
jgi:hypothetical protein